MVNNAKKMIVEDEMKKIKEKEYHKKYQDTVFHDNLENQARRQKAKSDSFAEDK
jgi:hypothetical protein